MNKAIFLDRDGVINKHNKNYVKSIDEFVILPNVEKYIKNLIQHGFKIIIITNQSMIGRGLCSIQTLEQIHKKMLDHFQSYDIIIDAVYFCPHTPDDKCSCRKPEISLFEDAIKKFQLDPKKSWVIGDNDSDISAGKKIGCNTIKILTDDDLGTYIDQILKNSN